MSSGLNDWTGDYEYPAERLPLNKGVGLTWVSRVYHGGKAGGVSDVAV